MPDDICRPRLCALLTCFLLNSWVCETNEKKSERDTQTNAERLDALEAESAKSMAKRSNTTANWEI